MLSMDGSKNKLMDDLKQFIKKAVNTLESWIDKLPEPFPNITRALLIIFTFFFIIDYVPNYIIYAVFLYLFVKYPKNSLAIIAALAQIGLFIYISMWLTTEVNPYLGLLFFSAPAIWYVIKLFK